MTGAPMSPDVWRNFLNFKVELLNGVPRELFNLSERERDELAIRPRRTLVKGLQDLP